MMGEGEILILDTQTSVTIIETKILFIYKKEDGHIFTFERRVYCITYYFTLDNRSMGLERYLVYLRKRQIYLKCTTAEGP